MTKIRRNRVIVLILVVIAIILLVLGFVLGSKGNSGTGNDDIVEVKYNDLQIPNRNISFKYPEGLQYELGNNCVVVLNSDNSLVSICYNYSSGYDGNIVKIISSYSDKFVSDISLLGKASLTGSITTNSVEKASFGERAAAKFTGVVKNVGGFDSYIYGYTFAIDELPIMIAGLITSSEQDSSLIEDINKLTDQIAGSIYTK